VSWARLIRYTCDRCGHSEDLVLTEGEMTVEPRLPEPGWSTMMLYSKAQTEGETLDRALCVNCTAEVIGWLEEPAPTDVVDTVPDEWEDPEARAGDDGDE
jgi:ribosomal protein S27AE